VNVADPVGTFAGLVTTIIAQDAAGDVASTHLPWPRGKICRLRKSEATATSSGDLRQQIWFTTPISYRAALTER